MVQLSSGILLLESALRVQSILPVVVQVGQRVTRLDTENSLVVIVRTRQRLILEGMWRVLGKSMVRGESKYELNGPGEERWR